MQRKPWACPCNVPLGHTLQHTPGYFLKNLSLQHVPQSLCNKPLSVVPVKYPWDISLQLILDILGDAPATNPLVISL